MPHVCSATLAAERQAQLQLHLRVRLIASAAASAACARRSCAAPRPVPTPMLRGRGQRLGIVERQSRERPRSLVRPNCPRPRKRCATCRGAWRASPANGESAPETPLRPANRDAQGQNHPVTVAPGDRMAPCSPARAGRRAGKPLVIGTDFLADVAPKDPVAEMRNAAHAGSSRGPRWSSRRCSAAGRDGRDPQRRRSDSHPGSACSGRSVASVPDAARIPASVSPSGHAPTHRSRQPAAVPARRRPP